MFLSTITPEQAQNPRIVTPEEEIHEALNTLLYSRFRGAPVTIYRDDLARLIGPDRWNLETHPQALDQVLQRYPASGWSLTETTSNPHSRCWSFAAA